MKTFLIRADADGKTGTGHIMRMLGLAQYWHDLGENVMFVSHCEIPVLRQCIMDIGLNLINAGGSREGSTGIDTLLLEADKATVNEPDFMPWVVMDGYGFTSEDQKMVKERDYPLLFVDDFGHASHYYADIILNQNLSADPSLYISREADTELLLGTAYAVLRREFRSLAGWRRSIHSVARKVLITMGGADSENVTEKVVRALKQMRAPDLDARVLIGPANPHLDRVKSAAASNSVPCRVVTQPNMPEELKWADVAIVGGGTICMEVALMGLPAMTVVMADNQVEATGKLASQGVTINLGWHRDLSETDLAMKIESFINDEQLRLRCSSAGQRLVDGNGVERITRRIMARSIRIRPVVARDCELIWKWANEPGARSASFNTDPISWQDHLKWFDRRLKKDGVKIYIAVTDRGVPLGQVRFELDSGCMIISVLLDPAFRSHGLGSALIDQACRQFSRDTSVSKVKAYIKPDNQASKRAFGAAGFREIGMTEVKGQKAVAMLYQVGDS